MLDQNIFPPFYLEKFEIVLWKAFTWAPCAHPLGAATNIGRHLRYPPSPRTLMRPSHHVFLTQNKLHILVFILSKILKCAFWSLIFLSSFFVAWDNIYIHVGTCFNCVVTECWWGHKPVWPAFLSRRRTLPSSQNGPCRTVPTPLSEAVTGCFSLS